MTRTAASRAQRARDERLLDWVRARTGGETSASVAARYGVRQERVRVATYRVMQADIEESGDPLSDVVSAYWDPVGGRRA